MNNDFEIRGEITAIFIKRKDGQVVETLIDTKDLPIACSFTNTWKLNSDRNNKNYVGIHSPREGGKRKYKRLHRVLMNAPENMVIDHINHNTLDNRRSNLRIITREQNYQNRSGAQSNSKSGIRGLHQAKNGKWRAQCRHNGKTYHIGTFENIEDAKKAVIEARKTLLPFSMEA